MPNRLPKCRIRLFTISIAIRQVLDDNTLWQKYLSTFFLFALSERPPLATMRFLSPVLLISTFGLQHVVGTGNAETPLLPIEDPFYLPPDGDHWKDLPPGSILKRREVTIAKLFIDKKSKAKAYQLLYSTQDVRGDPDASVTTIIVPVSPRNKRVISLQSAYDSPDPNCAPSFGLQYGAKGWSQGWTQLNLAFLTPYLQTGPILNIPDYEGSNAAFTGPTKWLPDFGFNQSCYDIRTRRRH
jgi:hypothetical protein